MRRVARRQTRGAEEEVAEAEAACPGAGNAEGAEEGEEAGGEEAPEEAEDEDSCGTPLRGVCGRRTCACSSQHTRVTKKT